MKNKIVIFLHKKKIFYNFNNNWRRTFDKIKKFTDIRERRKRNRGRGWRVTHERRGISGCGNCPPHHTTVLHSTPYQKRIFNFLIFNFFLTHQWKKKKKKKKTKKETVQSGPPTPAHPAIFYEKEKVNVLCVFDSWLVR